MAETPLLHSRLDEIGATSCSSGMSVEASNSDEWVQAIIGRDWEIFWGQSNPDDRKEKATPPTQENMTAVELAETGRSALDIRQHGAELSTTVTRTNTDAAQRDGDANTADVLGDTEGENDGSEHSRCPKDEMELDESDIEHEPDWYDASVVAFNPDDQRFDVQFVGDEAIYRMKLRPEVVRPSAVSWVKRTKAIMQFSEIEASYDAWKLGLPNDTRLPRDREELAAIRASVERDFRPKDAVFPIDLPLDHIEHAAELVVLIRTQISLRRKLVPIVCDSDCSDDEGPTEAYVNYLASCLHELEDCCQWFNQCWTLHRKIFGVLNDNHEEMTRVTPHFLVKECLERGRTILCNIFNMDLSVAGSKRKRLHCIESVDCKGTRRTKRHKKKTVADLRNREGEDDSSGRMLDQELEHVDLLSPEKVKRMILKMTNVSPSWLTQMLGSMLRSLSENIVSPYVEWEQRCQFYLGGRQTLDVESSDGETSGKESDAVGIDDVSTPPNAHAYVNYEDIVASIECTKKDRVLQHIDLSIILANLSEKLCAIVDFESSLWHLIQSVFKDECGENANDKVLEGLRSLSNTAKAIDSPVRNVEPFGRRGSPLNREVIESAILYRLWFLDLNRVEKSRERVDVVDGVVSRMSKLPSLPSRLRCPRGETIDPSKMLSTVAPRVKKLSENYIDFKQLFSKYKSMLEDRTRKPHEPGYLLSAKGILDALNDLQKIQVVSIAEEFLASRLDVLAWMDSAQRVLNSLCPSFDDLSRVHELLVRLMSGRSETRLQITKGLLLNSDIETEVEVFTKADLDLFCDSMVKDIASMYRASASWKEKADTVLATLHSFGNCKVREAGSMQKPSAMVDLKRIEELVREYPSLRVDVEISIRQLRDVLQNCGEWSSAIMSCLSDDSKTFEEYLGSIRNIGNQTRPKGIIMDPTRQALDTLADLLEWYTGLKKEANSFVKRSERLDLLLHEGLHIVRKYSQNFPLPHFEVDIKLALGVMEISRGISKPPKLLMPAKIEAIGAGQALLARMVDVERDKVEESPMLLLLSLLWQSTVDHFLDKTPSQEQTLQRALALKTVDPAQYATLNRRDTLNISSQGFYKLVQEGIKMEVECTSALIEAKSLLRDFLTDRKSIRSHLARLKDSLSNLKQRSSREACMNRLVLDKSLEIKMDQCVKQFSWLARALDYPVFQSRDHDVVIDVERRLSWENLVKLYDSIPLEDESMGDFAFVVLSVKELYDAAKSWQEEISRLTMLSLRGGKRRSNASPSQPKLSLTESQDDESSCMIDVTKVIELSEHPILDKITMPREDAVRCMLKNTKRFEVELSSFLGEDHPCPDRAPYPDMDSLVGVNGEFLLFRLTGSQPFRFLKSSISSISAIASNVFANTPGIATFDWIKKAVEWIDLLCDVVKQHPSVFERNEQRLGIDFTSALKLLKEGESIFLDVPDDLRKTLSKHKIYVSTNKEGRLTVKSKKGGAHYAVGTTAIRWCPVLFEALKSDVARTTTWESAINRLSLEFLEFRDQLASAEKLSDIHLLRYHAFHYQLARLVNEGASLVVAPPDGMVASSLKLLENLHSFIGESSNVRVAYQFADEKFNSGQSVVQDRAPLVEALVRRKSISAGSCAELNNNSDNGSFRQAGRQHFATALMKGLEHLGLQVSSDESRTLCALKAEEIERALFDQFQRFVGEQAISPEYKRQARAIKAGIADKGNAKLCGGVLQGDVDPAILVRMSDDELASPQVRQEREHAEKEAKKGVVLVPQSAAGRIVQGNHPSQNSQSKEKLQSPSDLSAVDSAASREDASTIERQKHLQSTTFGTLVKAIVSRQPPPAPPSLAASIAASQLSEMDTTFLLNSSGGDRITLSFGDGSRRFLVGFCAEGAVVDGVDGCLPNTWAEKGRLRISEFSKFVKAKLGSGKWAAAILRLVTFADKEAREFKKFYMEYETKERIAMLSLDETTKAYLVTPKFHEHVRGIRFETSSSTYAVVLKRREE